MKCPIDGTTLAISERNGIEIDYCPQCRGVWLDRGELDKIIERAAQYEANYLARQNTSSGEYKRKNDERYDDDDRKEHRKRRSFLDEVFDIFD